MSTDWRSITDEKEKYAAYLCSREWAEKREAVRERAENHCERCLIGPMEACHHLTYLRKYDEQLEDLQAICNGCHEFTHGKANDDPADAMVKTQEMAIAFCIAFPMSAECVLLGADKCERLAVLDFLSMNAGGTQCGTILNQLLSACDKHWTGLQKTEFISLQVPDADSAITAAARRAGLLLFLHGETESSFLLKVRHDVDCLLGARSR
jgi:hypothetical protein